MLTDIITPKMALFGDDVQTVLRGHENRSRRVVILNGNMTQNVRSSVRGVNARVCRNGVFGFSSSSEYSAEAAEKVLKAATDNAAFFDLHAGRNLELPPSFGKGTVELNRDIIDTEQKRIIDACRTIDSYILKTYPDLTSRTVIYTEDSTDKIICTSDAHSGHVTIPRCYVYVFMDAESLAGPAVTLFKAFGGYGSFDDHFATVDWVYPDIDKLHSQLMEKREGVYAEAGLKTVIIGDTLGGMLAHEAVGHTVEADLVKGGSIAAHMLNKRVASDLVSMVDFAHTAFGETAPLPVYLDDEGTLAEDAVLIKDGILTGYMNDRESARDFGVKPAGNARAWQYNDEPLIRMRNTFILPGTSKLEDMIASIDDGYYLVKTMNGQADMTGEFMFGVSMGYEIKNGKLGKAILDTTVTGVAFDMLQTVDMVSDHITASSSGFCGKKQMIPVGMGGPEMRCKITMGGR